MNNWTDAVSRESVVSLDQTAALTPHIQLRRVGPVIALARLVSQWPEHWVDPGRYGGVVLFLSHWAAAKMSTSHMQFHAVFTSTSRFAAILLTCQSHPLCMPSMDRSFYL